MGRAIMELRDKNGLTEQEFLKAYCPGQYPRPSVTVDIMLLSTDREIPEVLLIRRGGHPFLGYWALPGGFVDPHESTETAAARELEEETRIQGLPLYPLTLCSTPGRDPRSWTMSAVYLSLASRKALAVRAGDDAVDARWFSLSRDGAPADTVLTLSDGDGITLTAALRFTTAHTPFGDTYDISVLDPGGIAFDHAGILLRGYLAWESMKQHTNLADR